MKTSFTLAFILALILNSTSSFAENDKIKLQEKDAVSVVKINKPIILSKPAMSLDLARRIALSAEMKAKELGTSVAIVVLDEQQNVKIEYVMDGQTTISLDWARAKALSAFEFMQATNNGEFKVLRINDKTMVVGASGGYPLIYKGKPIASIGVSGTRGPEDDVIAQFAQSEFNKVISK